jgi:hypothetical protein
MRSTYRSMFRASSWLLLEEPFLTAKVLRKLTGILELPGMIADRQCWENV